MSAGACARPGGTLTLTGAAVTANAVVVASGWDTSGGKIPLQAATVTLPWGNVSVTPSLPGLTFRMDTVVPADLASGSYPTKSAGAADASFNVPCATAKNQRPLAVAGGPIYRTKAGVPVTFDGSGSTDAEGSPLSYRWHFGDGTTGTGPAPAHVYAFAGSYMVTLIVNDGIEASAPMIGTHSFAMVIVAADADRGGSLGARGGCGCATSPNNGSRGFAIGVTLLLAGLRRRQKRALKLNT